MNAEIAQHVRDTAAQLGAGVPYALKVMAGQLADDPDMGQPSGLPGILTVMVDGDLFEDCPALAVGYIREPDRIEIRYVNPAPSAEPAADTQAQAQDQHADPAADTQDQDQDQPADPAADTVTGRVIADAWQRITRWLQHNAPDSHAALRAGVSPTTITALEHDLGIQIPADLRALWFLTAGDDGVNGAGCLPGNQALMTLDAVAAFYGQQMDSQAHQDTLNARRPECDRITVWKAAWIPVVSYGAADRTSGLYLDAATGYLGRWSRYNEGPGDELDTLATYLEDVADMLEAPALATRDKPGLVGGALVWGSRLDPAQEDRWQPLTG
ncbi:SMI1/KNR4 family protein [Streptomyces sp. XD-27]|uniref:SMI1/KNR4 family protein n=1 Tax=Streptomyces sp. XD-27 TaxID=3062779 RepID=UPI0026F44D55|nr:SMI1/KNR4 family protein [Streptomyces sp. XD-27]WKX69576.1 SMI1/KNR4 family protein [Streptomyces sp. XD-27]